MMKKNINNNVFNVEAKEHEDSIMSCCGYINNIANNNYVTNNVFNVEAKQLAGWIMPLLAYYSYYGITTFKAVPFNTVSFVESYIVSSFERDIYPSERDFMYSGLLDYELERADELKEIKRLGRINYINNGVEYKNNPKEWIAAFSNALSDNINQSNNIKVDLANNCFIVNYDKQLLKLFIDNFDPKLLELLKKMCISVMSDYSNQILSKDTKEQNNKTYFYR